MPAPYQIASAVASTGLAYSPQRHVETLCDGTLLTSYQSAAATISLVQIKNANGTPTTTTLSQTFTIAGSTNTVADIFVANNGTTSSDVWVAYTTNTSSTGLYVAHATYTASGQSWSWDNTGTSIALGGFTHGFMVPSIIWTGSTLMVALRANGGNYGIALTYTTTKSGNVAANWSAIATIDGGNLTSHCYPVLLHDATNALTVLVYTLAGDTLYAVTLADSLAPTAANWNASGASGRRVALTGTINVGAANFDATLDPTNARLHVIYDDSGSAASPHYVNATYNSSTLTPGTPFSVSTAATTAAGVALGLTSAGTVYLFWGTGAAGSASDIMYNTLASPYASGNLGTAVNLTNNTANDNAYPQLPTLLTLNAGYVPLLYAHAVSPWAVEYDNSLTFTTGASGGFTIPGSGSMSIGGGIVGGFTIPGSGSLAFGGHEVVTGGGFTIPGHGSMSISAGNGTGIADLSVSTQPQTWVNSGSDTETVIAYKDGSQSGWAVGINPGYGGAVASALYEVNNGAVAGAGALNSNGNQVDMYTVVGGGTSGATNPDGLVHSLEQSPSVTFNSGYDGSETYPFQNAGMLVEQAPTGTGFRRGYLAKVNNDVALQTGLKVYVTTFVYPGDPGYLVSRIDWINPTGAPISLTSLNLTAIGGLVDTSATPAGAWTHTNAKAGTVGGSSTTTVPSSLTAGEPDFFWITPNSSPYGQKVGLVAVKGTVLGASGYNWAPTYAYAESTTAGTPNDRLKFYYQTGGSSFSIPANTTHSLYLLQSLRRNLTAADAAAIAADYLNPGALTVATGTAQTQSSDTPVGRTASAFNWTRRAWVVQAASNRVNLTLDLTPANVSVRFKPAFEFPNWTGGAPSVTWGGSALTAGVDYRYTVDTSTNTLYLQLYFDVVASSPTGNQRTNAALAVAPTTYSGGFTLAEAGGLSIGGHQRVSHSASGVLAQVTTHASHSATGAAVNVSRHVAHQAGSVLAQVNAHTAHRASGATAQLHAHLTHSASGALAQLTHHASHSATGALASVRVHVAHSASGALAQTRAHVAHTASGATVQIGVHATHTASGALASVRNHVAHSAGGATVQLHARPTHSASGAVAQVVIGSHATHTASAALAQLTNHASHHASGAVAQLKNHVSGVASGALAQLTNHAHHSASGAVGQLHAHLLAQASGASAQLHAHLTLSAAGAVAQVTNHATHTASGALASLQGHATYTAAGAQVQLTRHVTHAARGALANVRNHVAHSASGALVHLQKQSAQHVAQGVLAQVYAPASHTASGVKVDLTTSAPHVASGALVNVRDHVAHTASGAAVNVRAHLRAQASGATVQLHARPAHRASGAVVHLLLPATHLASGALAHIQGHGQMRASGATVQLHARPAHRASGAVAQLTGAWASTVGWRGPAIVGVTRDDAQIVSTTYE